MTIRLPTNQITISYVVMGYVPTRNTDDGRVPSPSRSARK